MYIGERRKGDCIFSIPSPRKYLPFLFQLNSLKEITMAGRYSTIARAPQAQPSLPEKASDTAPPKEEQRHSRMSYSQWLGKVFEPFTSVVQKADKEIQKFRQPQP
jgi:hypothetical protein